MTTGGAPSHRGSAGPAPDLEVRLIGSWRPGTAAAGTGPAWHPDVTRLVARFAHAGVPTYDTLDVATARAVSEQVTDLQQPPQAVESVADVAIDGPGRPLWLRVYRSGGDGPVVVYMHGGGFVLGSVEAGDAACRSLANAARCTVVSVDYRLAPEDPFPAGLEDCAAAVAWVRGTLAGAAASGRVVLLGDSAGGNLAAATALLLAERGEPAPDAVVLLYPTLAPPDRVGSRSYKAFAGGPVLTRGELVWFWSHYLGGTARPDAPLDPLAAPLLAPDLAGFPAATVVVAELDPLHDDGVRFAQRLHAAGVDTELFEVPGASHGLWWMDRAMSQAAELTAALVPAVRGSEPEVSFNTGVDATIGAFLLSGPWAGHHPQAVLPSPTEGGPTR